MTNPQLNLGDQPAFPHSFKNASMITARDWDGLSKREHIAALALQGLLADSEFMFSAVELGHETGGTDVPLVAHMATIYADALLKELAKERPS